MATSDPYWSTSLAALIRLLDTRIEGLSSEQAHIRAMRHGPNAVEADEELLALSLLLRQLASPLVLILVFGAVVSLVLQDWTNAIIILVIVLGSVLLGFSQEYRASRAVARLRRSLALTTRVFRDGKLQALLASELVPGDIIRLSAGNLVPADGVVIDATDFLVTEASLTGEPFPVQKQAGELAADTPIAERTNCVYSGTSVRSGTATVLVVEIGRRTALGAIAASLKSSAPETEFTRGVRQFGYLLLRVMLITVIFVLAVNQLFHRPAIESLLFAVALAVGLSPELLPAIVSVTLSHGARAMARRGVIIRRPEAIENLGSMDVLCTDKTGTLTEGVIELNDAVDPDGNTSSSVRWLAYLNAAFETGIENPLDAALIAAGEKEKMSTDGLRKIDEIPYDFIRRRLTIVVQEPASQDRHLIITKGAFSNVLELCTALASTNGERPLDDEARRKLQDYYECKGRKGFRVLAVATRHAEPKADYVHEDESAMAFAGFLLFFDPLKTGAGKTLHDLAALGIRVKIITGDNRYVAAHVAEGLGLECESMLTGAEMSRLNEESLRYRAERTDLFAEVDPQQKEHIVRTLQRAGHVVGYIGDGINDGPPLHIADVGISVDKAVDVAREAADVILLRPDLDVLCNGVREGRRTFANTLKYICVTTSANFGNMMSMAFATSVLDFLPLSAKQILLNNFLSDIPSIAISTDKVDRERVEHARRWNLREVRQFMIVFGLVSSAFDLLTFATLIKVFHADVGTFQTAWFVVSLLTELVVVLVLRTAKPAWRSRPSRLLLATTALVGALAFCIPYIPYVAHVFGFVPLSWPMALTAMAIVLGYILCTEAVKRRFFAS
ncbi:magnesium-translocating P-type ATPase [Herbaspirillum sp. ST 5-3]|uniref:magnesium-translocating P-type ATPase n=1 Tax=Oxalobacteraceae TaxID=75682 RepID=UPI0010A54E93|nr:magnesium-translocating P-type ATPase [Herbaspirillum sp. ST 5-3]